MPNQNNHTTFIDQSKDHLNESEASSVNLRSEAVQDILGRPPRWMIRWGITIIFIVVLGLFVGSYFFKYPEIVLARVTVNSEHLPTHIVSKISGRIDSLFVSDGQRVSPNTAVALLQNPTSFRDYLILKSEWKAYRELSPYDDTVVFFPFTVRLQLGELQNAYSALLKAYNDYLQFVTQDFHNKKIQALRLQIQKQQRILDQQNRQLQSAQQQIAIAQSTFKTDSALYTKGIISSSEYDQAKQTLLNALQSIESAKNVTTSQQISILQNEQQVFDLEREQQLQNSQHQLNFSNAKEQFFSQLSSWEQNYFLQSPIAGTISFTRFFQQHQNIGAGEILLTVVPDSVQRLTGRIFLPQRGAGKVKVGQSVNIKFEHFPHLEFGMARAKVRNISAVPIQDKEQSFLVVEVDFPNGLKTNYGKTLSFTQNMEGSAEIITEDLRLIDRFINPIRAVLKR
jgi:HlyD family secretion protein